MPEQDEPRLSHLDAEGHAHMVNVSGKAVTERMARARATVNMQPATLELALDGQLPKGDVFAVVRIAAIQAAKQTGTLIPLCHPLPLSGVDVEFTTDRQAGRLEIEVSCMIEARTGVEMEALTAASVAALTFYDMCKAVDKGMVIGPVLLIEKHGGRSGSWYREENPAC